MKITDKSLKMNYGINDAYLKIKNSLFSLKMSFKRLFTIKYCLNLMVKIPNILFKKILGVI